MKRYFDEICVAVVLAAVALAGFLGGTPPAYAWTDVLVRIDTAMPSMVMVSSAIVVVSGNSTDTGKGATRIDNWNVGKQGVTSQLLLGGRTTVCCVNVSTFTASVFVGWSNLVSTQSVTTTFPQVGEEIAKGMKTCRAADRSLALWALGSDSAGSRGVALSCEQLGKNNP